MKSLEGHLVRFSPSGYHPTTYRMRSPSWRSTALLVAILQSVRGSAQENSQNLGNGAGVLCTGVLLAVGRLFD